jgi:hypothetical protein
VAEPTSEYHTLSEAVLAYLIEYDNPTRDYKQRRELRNHLRKLLGAPGERVKLTLLDSLCGCE